MKDKYTLIMPMLGGTNENGETPIQYQYDKYGNLNCIKSLFGIPHDNIDIVYFVILKSHDELFSVSNKIEAELAAINKVEPLKFKCNILLFDKITGSQADTVYTAIKYANINGPLFIKDVDNVCYCDNITISNSALIYSLENTNLVDPQHKSYIAVDEQNFITNIIEKRVVSDMFNCGGYSFTNTDDFIEAYEAIKNYETNKKHMYISNIIYWLILNKNLKFRPIIANKYEDFIIK